jgi:hypothetical protein
MGRDFMFDFMRATWRRIADWMSNKPPKGVSKEDWFDRQQW